MFTNEQGLVRIKYQVAGVVLTFLIINMLLFLMCFVESLTVKLSAVCASQER